jgi:hypothetical protein
MRAGSTSSFSEISSPDAVPEPGTLALLGVGLIGVGFSHRLKRSASNGREKNRVRQWGLVT